MQKRIDATAYGIDTTKASSLLPNYEEFFAHLADKDVKLLELGVQKGASMLLWRDYFEKGTIVGLDRDPVHIDDPTGRIRVYEGYQQDTNLLDLIAMKEAPEGFDIIIDDCSHIGKLARTSFWHLFENHLRPGGIYAIEDWATGYMERWFDGRRYRRGPRRPYYRPLSRKDHMISIVLQQVSAYSPKLASLLMRISMSSRIPSHNYGMVGFVKELVDACCLGQIASPRLGDGRYRYYKIHRMHIFWNHVILVKSNQQETSHDDSSAGRAFRRQ